MDLNKYQQVLQRGSQVLDRAHLVISLQLEMPVTSAKSQGAKTSPSCSSHHDHLQLKLWGRSPTQLANADLLHPSSSAGLDLSAPQGYNMLLTQEKLRAEPASTSQTLHLQLSLLVLGAGLNSRCCLLISQPLIQIFVGEERICDRISLYSVTLAVL